jgi:hypothetical protein
MPVLALLLVLVLMVMPDEVERLIDDNTPGALGRFFPGFRVVFLFGYVINPAYST